jgi:hypothetical protein
MEDTDYPERMIRDYAHIVTKCKNLRHNLRRKAYPRSGAMGSFLHTISGFKLSGTFRKMCRDVVDISLPGPPSFFTRRKDGISVPALNEFMTGYRNLIKMNIPSKTLEISYLVMNRQIWTNQKWSKGMAERHGVQENPGCKLCGRVENTMHLLFDCEKYSEPLWTMFEQVIKNAMQIDNDGVAMQYPHMHAFVVLYNMDTNVPIKYRKPIMETIQEIKRNMVFRRYKRETSNGGIINYGRERLLAHLLLTIEKLLSLRRYQGRNALFFEQMQSAIRAMIS